MNKKRKFIIAAVAFMSIGVLLYGVIASQQNIETAKFTGKITAEKIDCILADDQEVIYVDNKKIVVDPGNVASRGEVGVTSEDLHVCNNFDINAVKKDRQGFRIEGQPNGGEELIGRSVEVNAAVLNDGSFTLQGSNNYYVKTIN